MTLHLWRALMNPLSGHPLFQRTLRQNSLKPNHRLRRMLYIVLGLYLLAILGLSLILEPLLQFIIYTVVGGLIAGVSAIMPFYGNLVSVGWLGRVSGAIASARALGTYDLLCLPPSGALGANWLICTGCLYANRSFHRFYLTMRVLLLLGLVGAMLFTFSLDNWRPGQPTWEKALETFIYSGTLVAAIGVDYVQSVVLSCLAAMLAPAYTRSRFDSQVWALGVFVVIQAVGYALSACVGLFLLPMIYEEVSLTTGVIYLSLPVLQVIVFYAIREALIRLLWRILIARLSADSAEIDAVTCPLKKVVPC